MAKRADVWPRRKNGKIDSWYFRRLRLKTKDATEARRRARLAEDGKWPPKEEGAAKVTAEAFTFDPPAPPEPAPPPASSPPPPPPQDPPPAQPVTGDWTTAAAAASSEAREESNPPPPPPPPPQVSSDQIANLVVDLQLQGTEMWAQYKYYEGFIAPQIAPQGRAMLAGAYQTIFTYFGAAAVLPPWVNGALIPGLAVVASSMAIAAGFRDAALKQKAAAAQQQTGGGA